MLTRRKISIGAGILACALATGCTSYYKVKDPGTGKVYYTTELKQRNGGAVTLKDGRSGDTVTIQNSQVQSINKERYESAKATSGENPEAKAAEAKAAEQRAADQLAADQRAAEARAAEQRAAEQQAADARAAEAKAAEAKAAEDAAVAGGVVGSAAAKQAASLQQVRANLVASQQQIDRTLTALSGLADPNQADLSAAYKRFDGEVTKMKQHAQQTTVEADGMRQARDDYFARWDARIAATENPTIRTEAETKRARLRAAHEKISADATLAKDAYKPFISGLEDTRKFLATDVSKEAMSVLSPTVKKAQQDGQLLNQRIDAVVADLDAVEGKGATTKPSPSAADGTTASTTEAQNLLDQTMAYVKENKLDLAEKSLAAAEQLKPQLPAPSVRRSTRPAAR